MGSHEARFGHVLLDTLPGAHSHDFPAPLGIRQSAEASVADTDDLRNTLLHLTLSIERHYVEVGRLLLYIRDRELYRQWGFETLHAFGEATLHFRRDKLRYFMRVAALVDRLCITPEELAGVTGSKLLILTPVLTVSNKADWLAQARAVNAKILRAKVAAARGFAPQEEPVTTFVVRLSPTQRQTLEDALTLGMQLAETTSRAVALVSIAEEAISSFAPLVAAQDLLVLPLSLLTDGDNHDPENNGHTL